MARFLGYPKIQYFKTGTVEYLDGGKLYSYEPGTAQSPSNYKATYSTIADAVAGTNPHTNPIVLDSRGEATVVLNGSTQLLLTDSLGNTIWSVDNVDAASADIVDGNGNALLQFISVDDAVNAWTITNAVAGGNPRFDATGSDVNITAKIASKGSGNLEVDGGSTGDLELNKNSTGTIRARRNTVVTGTLNVSSTSTLSSSAHIVGAVTLDSTLDVAGTLTATAAVSFLPAGCFMWYCGSSVPTGYLECDGTAKSRATYAALFTAIGTTYGAGDGSTTFNLPNLQRRVVVGKGGSGTATLANTLGATGGEETHTMTTAELVAHSHTYTYPNALTVNAGVGANSCNGGASTGFSTSSTGSTTPFNVMQPSLVLMAIIRAV